MHVLDPHGSPRKASGDMINNRDDEYNYCIWDYYSGGFFIGCIYSTRTRDRCGDGVHKLGTDHFVSRNFRRMEIYCAPPGLVVSLTPSPSMVHTPLSGVHAFEL